MSLIPEHNPAWALLAESGSAAVAFDSLISAAIRAQGKTVTVPIENGSFAVYNKTDSPLEVLVTLASARSAAEQQKILSDLSALKSGTELVSLVTPAQEYRNLTLENFAYERAQEKGATLLLVECDLKEVRQTAVRAGTSSTNITAPKNPGSAPVEETGKRGNNSILYDMHGGVIYPSGRSAS